MSHPRTRTERKTEKQKGCIITLLQKGGVPLRIPSSRILQKGGVPAAPSGTATLLRHKARERIHRAMADARLLANPASWGRVADPNPNYDAFF